MSFGRWKNKIDFLRTWSSWVFNWFSCWIFSFIKSICCMCGCSTVEISAIFGRKKKLEKFQKENTLSERLCRWKRRLEAANVSWLLLNFRFFSLFTSFFGLRKFTFLSLIFGFMALLRSIFVSTNRLISRNIRMSANMQERAAEAVEKLKSGEKHNLIFKEL